MTLIGTLTLLAVAFFSIGYTLADMVSTLARRER